MTRRDLIIITDASQSEGASFPFFPFPPIVSPQRLSACRPAHPRRRPPLLAARYECASSTTTSTSPFCSRRVYAWDGSMLESGLYAGCIGKGYLGEGWCEVSKTIQVRFPVSHYYVTQGRGTTVASASLSTTPTQRRSPSSRYGYSGFTMKTSPFRTSPPITISL